MAVVDFLNQETVKAVTPCDVIITSAGIGHDNLVINHCRYPSSELPEFFLLQHTIVVYVGDVVEIERVSEGKLYHGYYTTGKVGILPANMPHTVYLSQGFEYIGLHLNPNIFSDFFYELISSDCCDLVTLCAIDNSIIFSIAHLLKTEYQSNNWADKLLVESLQGRLVDHLLKNYTINKYPTWQENEGLSKSKFNTVINYIHDYLDKDLSLCELSKQVGLSPNYFTRLFKKSSGITPHKYVEKCRIDKAKQLLAKSNLTLAEISQQVGFYDQSRFTSVFRKNVGVTPKKFRFIV